MTTPATQRAERWRRYLADLEAHAAVPQALTVRVPGDFVRETPPSPA